MREGPRGVIVPTMTRPLPTRPTSLAPAALVALVALVAGLLVGGTTVTALAGSERATLSVTVCATGKGVVRSATARGACPKGTTKRKVGVTGPRGPRGPGSTPIRASLAPSSNDQTLRLGPFDATVACLASGEVYFFVPPEAVSLFYGTASYGGINGAGSSVESAGYRSNGGGFGNNLFSTSLGQLGLDITADVTGKGLYDIEVALIWDATLQRCRVVGTSTFAAPPA